ncbi:MAG: type II toxin-antitoxin system VapC family toxin [Micromonosporaceae bacterium]|nr:type II toxin-antitoxin system VapC family toxin [Micromonosporaceae bacterium]
MGRPDNPTSVYLDSNALILAVTARPGHEPVAEILRLADTGQLTVAISTLSLVEVRGWGRTDPYPPDLDHRCVAQLDHPRLLMVEFHRDVALRARRYAHHYRLKNPDAIHLASAVEAEVDVLMTYDADFPHAQSVEGVWIDDPYFPGGDPIPGL